MERAYRMVVLLCLVVVVPTAVLSVAMLLGVVPPPQQPPVLAAAATCFTAVAVHGLMRVAGARALRFPWPRAADRAGLLMMVGFLSLLAYGIIRWPKSPISFDGTAYVDKLGGPATEKSFNGFRVWECAFLLFGTSAFTFAAIRSIPGTPATGTRNA